MTGAGFADPEIEEISFDFHYPDADDVWDAIVRLAGPLAQVVKKLPDEERQATREAILQNLGPYRNEDGSYTAPAATWAVLTR